MFVAWQLVMCSCCERKAISGAKTCRISSDDFHSHRNIGGSSQMTCAKILNLTNFTVVLPLLPLGAGFHRCFQIPQSCAAPGRIGVWLWKVTSCNFWSASQCVCSWLKNRDNWKKGLNLGLFLTTYKCNVFSSIRQIIPQTWQMYKKL